VQIQQNKLCI